MPAPDCQRSTVDRPLLPEVGRGDARIGRQLGAGAGQHEVAGLEHVAFVGHLQGRALMGRPKLLMLDEPSLGLAPLIVREIFSIIVALRQSGVSILLVEQNVHQSLKIADRAYVLE